MCSNYGHRSKDTIIRNQNNYMPINNVARGTTISIREYDKWWWKTDFGQVEGLINKNDVGYIRPSVLETSSRPDEYDNY